MEKIIINATLDKFRTFKEQCEYLTDGKEGSLIIHGDLIKDSSKTSDFYIGIINVNGQTLPACATYSDKIANILFVYNGVKYNLVSAIYKDRDNALIFKDSPQVDINHIYSTGAVGRAKFNSVDVQDNAYGYIVSSFYNHLQDMSYSAEEYLYSLTINNAQNFQNNALLTYDIIKNRKFSVFNKDECGVYALMQIMPNIRKVYDEISLYSMQNLGKPVSKLNFDGNLFNKLWLIAEENLPAESKINGQISAVAKMTIVNMVYGAIKSGCSPEQYYLTSYLSRRDFKDLFYDIPTKTFADSLLLLEDDLANINWLLDAFLQMDNFSEKDASLKNDFLKSKASDNKVYDAKKINDYMSHYLIYNQIKDFVRMPNKDVIYEIKKYLRKRVEGLNACPKGPLCS